jgi:hypothetical protein
VLFRDFEIPETIGFGGSQRLAVHNLPGGARIVDVLGRDDSSVRFSGIFTGPDATLRARLIDDLRATGAVLTLSWDVFFYTVIVSQFKADYTSTGWIPYSVVATVVRDEAGALLQSVGNLGQSLLADAASALGLASSGGIDLSAMQSALSDPTASVRGTGAFSMAQSAVADAQTSLATGSGQAASDLPMTTLTSPGSAQSGISALMSAVVAAGQASQLSAASGYVGRISSNLTNAGT